MIENLEKELNEAREPGAITAIRGRLINTINKELAALKRKKELTPEEKEKKIRLEYKRTANLIAHRKDLDNRIKNEFIKEKAVIGSLITVLPKGVSLSVQKVINSIRELQDAKTNKERIFSTIELLKSTGLMAAVPVIYGTKFILRHWYLLLISLGILDISENGFVKGILGTVNITEDNNKILGTLRNIRENRIVSMIRDGEHFVLDKTFSFIKDTIGGAISR